MAEREVTDHIAFIPGEGLEVTSGDGDFSVTTRVRLQVLGETEWVDGGEPALSVQLRRARLSFAGCFFGRDNRYKLELALSPRDVGRWNNLTDGGPTVSPLLDFYFEFRELRDLTVRVGQYKVPFNRERVISSGDLQLVDRSIVNGEFNLDRDVGFDLRSKDLFGLGFLRYYLGAYIARGRDAVGFDDFGLMYIGRVEVLPFGMFEDYEESDLERSFDPRLSLGFAYSFLDRARRDQGILGDLPADGGTTDMHVIVADAMFKWAGLSVMSEYIWRDGTRDSGPAASPADLPRDGFGFMAQAGYLIPRQPIEIAARYGMVRGISPTSRSDENELGVGLNGYIGRHAYKLQVDYFRFWGAVASGSPADFTDGDHRIRVQLQGSI